VAILRENVIKEAKTEAKTEASKGHPSIHTNFVPLIKRKDTMSPSAEKLHEKKMGTTATTMAMAMATEMEMEMEIGTAGLGRVDQRPISPILLNFLSLTMRTQ
jgi:hypothetical protein